MNPYETEQLLNEYLLFHYGDPEEVCPYAFGPREALDFPARCVRAGLAGPSSPFSPSSPSGMDAMDSMDFMGGGEPVFERVLDVGCAVGRSSFELARGSREVVGIDFSRSFIQAANHLKAFGQLEYQRLEEGARFTACLAKVPPAIERQRVQFEVGDACDLRADLGQFDAVLAANLLCRLPDPAKFLERAPALVKPGGALVLTTPCTWMEQYTPREKWLCDENSTTLDGLHRHLDAHFRLVRTLDLPFLIREHARKFQWTVSLLSVWRKA